MVDRRRVDSILTDANERAKALSDIVSDYTRVEFERARLIYMDTVAQMVQQFELDKQGQIVLNARNAQIADQIAALGEEFRSYVNTVIGQSPIVRDSLQAAVVSGGSTLGRALGLRLMERMANDQLQSYIARRAEAIGQGASRLARDTSETVNSIVREALENFTGDADNLNRLLFGQDAYANLKARNDEMLGRISQMRGRVEKIVDAVPQGGDLDDIRDKFRKDVQDYLEKRKAYLDEAKANGQDPRIDPNRIETRSSKEVVREIMDTHQDAIHRFASEEFGEDVDVLYVNAKNTAHDDNCIQAMEAEPMTIAQWKKSSFGEPRSASRDCTVYCRCLLYPVGRAGDDIDITGADVSDTGGAI